jgi:hypothetical protein
MIFNALVEDAGMEWAMIDSAIIRALLRWVFQEDPCGLRCA